MVFSHKPKRSRLIILYITAFVNGIFFQYLFGQHSYTVFSHPSKVNKILSTTNDKFCQNANPCIFDIGHNTGQDTLFYLTSSFTPSTTKVLAVDANPSLMNRSSIRFSSDISSGRLRLLNIGLVKQESESSSKSEQLIFWVNRNDKFSSFTETGGCRNGYGKVMPLGDHTFCKKIYVQTRTCASLIREFGSPTYMKIDIEGMDMQCLHSLATVPTASRPTYISVENVHKYSISKLQELGFTKFKAVNQKNFEYNTENPELNGMSGPWGEKAKDYILGMQWISAEDMKKRLPLPLKFIVDGKEVGAWYDLHAKRE